MRFMKTNSTKDAANTDLGYNDICPKGLPLEKLVAHNDA